MEEIENVKRIFQATGEEINKLDESYALFGDNSNSVAYLLGRSLGLSDAQLKGLAGQLDTGVFGAPGFGDDLMNGADGDYAGMSVEEFLQKAKESGAITDEQIQAITEKVEEILVPVQRIPTAELAGAGASAAFMSYARLAGWTEESWLDEAWEQGVASFAITEVAKDIADWNFEGSDYNLFDWNAAGGSLVASLAANALGDELGLGGTDAASVVGASMAISGMSYSIKTLTTAAEFSASTGLGSMANAGAGALGTWAASQVLHSHTNAEAVGAAVGGWKPSHESGDTNSGLKIDTYTQPDSNLRVIAIAGTDFGMDADFIKDLIADAGFVTGKVTAQVKQALEYVAKQLDAANSGSQESGLDSPEFILTGHSLGGGLAQIIGAVFDLPGMSLDGPGAAAIVNNPELQEVKAQLLDKYPNAAKHMQEMAFGDAFVNFNEDGSGVSGVGEIGCLTYLCDTIAA